MTINLADRFTDMALFAMFTIDCNPDSDRKDSSRTQTEDYPYAMGDIMIPLWSMRERKLPRGERVVLQGDDHIRAGITDERPGSSRVADLAAFYSENAEAEISAFIK